MKKIRKKLKYLKIKILLKLVEKEIKDVLDTINEKNTNKLISLIESKKNIFLTGQGRSGLVAEAFGMRLMQLGFNVYIAGEATTPSITKSDLLIAISGSGKTKITEDIVNEAKNKNTKIVLITANKNSPIAKKSALTIEINARTKTNNKKSIEPLGSLFEQSAFIYLDSVIILLMKKTKKKEKYLRKKHANLE